MDKLLLSLWVCLAAVPLFGQRVQPGELAVVSPVGTDTNAMSVREKFRYEARHFFDVDNIVFAGLGAALDQSRNQPSEWGQGWGAFSKRFGSHFGEYVIQRSVMSTVRALDHEDARFYRSTHRRFAARAGDALLQTVWRRSDQGGMIPAYSEFIGDYGAAAISRQWWPDRFHNASTIFVAGTNSLLIDGGVNVLHEFTPDMKRWLHWKH